MLKSYWHMTTTRDSCRVRAEGPQGFRTAPFRASHDSDAVATLYAEAFSDKPWPSDWADFAGFDPGGVFLAYDDTKPVGFIISYLRPDSPDEGYLSVVGILPLYRRRGIAAALIQRAICRFWELGYHRVAIDVAAENLPALRLYERSGFTKVSEFTADEHCRAPLAEP